MIKRQRSLQRLPGLHPHGPFFKSLGILLLPSLVVESPFCSLDSIPPAAISSSFLSQGDGPVRGSSLNSPPGSPPPGSPCCYLSLPLQSLCPVPCKGPAWAALSTSVPRTALDPGPISLSLLFSDPKFLSPLYSQSACNTYKTEIPVICNGTNYS